MGEAKRRKLQANLAGSSQPGEKPWGIRYDIPGVVLNEPPESVLRLRTLLALPEHRDIAMEAIKGKDFSEVVGTIAAMLDIALDGDYDGDSLCKLLCRALERRKEFKNEMHRVDPSLVSAEITEREGDISLDLGRYVPQPKGKLSGNETAVAAHVLFMAEHECSLCDDRDACTREGICLASEGGGVRRKDATAGGKLQ